ncbi:hypothetical protein HCN44_000037 [Aphidius gifuensis]|uniref:CAF1B/HIR1 beta-propeller domain-containing protein n=1 Tax=Aphidius gifuensis TaxID=684658 RepID=A0A834XR98_APHGI|nr:hypothetical protein HCN44_000037 [Aphidius gifuensis]
MKCTIPEISWHNRDPVLSIDVQCSTDKNVDNGIPFWRVATAGADSHIWHLTVNELGVASITCVADFDRSTKAVNVVRFSPSGEVLATGDDESTIILWKQKEESNLPILPGDENQNKEQWISWKALRGHLEDIYDLSWSPDSNFIVSGSVDNTAIIWDVQKGRQISILSDYKGFVQGVTWDPCNQYIATLSTDRQCRLIDLTTMKTINRVNKAKLPTPIGHSLENKTVRLFHDDTFKSFFRRLTFSIDGSLIIAPSGIIEFQESTERITNATIVFSRHNLKEPIMILPSLDESTIAVRCCPVYFELRNDGPISMLALPYRLVFAVATQKSVIIYDTQQISPIAVISNIHYTRLTDVAWSSDGQILVVSSTDGYCSIIHFQDGELGTIYKAEKSIIIKNLTINKVNQQKPIVDNNKLSDKKNQKEEILAECHTDAMDIDSTKNDTTNVVFCTPNIKDNDKKDNINDQLKTDEVCDGSQDIKLIYSDTSTMENTNVINDNLPKVIETVSSKIDDTSSVKTPPKDCDSSTTKTTPTKPPVAQVLLNKTPRRVKLITLSSPKRTKNQ